MISKPPADVMQALMRLRSEQNFQRVMNWLSDVERELDEKARDFPEEWRVRKAQGGAALISELRSFVEEAKRIR